MPPDPVLVNLELNDGPINSNIFKKALAARNPKLAVNHVQLLETYFSLEADAELLDPCVAQVIVADIQDRQVTILEHIVQINSSVVAELDVVAL